MKVKGTVNKLPRVAYYQCALQYSTQNFNDILSTPLGVEVLDSATLSSTLIMSLICGASVIKPENIMLDLKRNGADGQLSVATIIGKFVGLMWSCHSH